eukprot:scaffold2236_cov385-Prasinococcus_capsulatus_cf.AAC.12
MLHVSHRLLDKGNSTAAICRSYLRLQLIDQPIFAYRFLSNIGLNVPQVHYTALQHNIAKRKGTVGPMGLLYPTRAHHQGRRQLRAQGAGADSPEAAPKQHAFRCQAAPPRYKPRPQDIYLPTPACGGWVGVDAKRLCAWSLLWLLAVGTWLFQPADSKGNKQKVAEVSKIVREAMEDRHVNPQRQLYFFRYGAR